MLAYPMTRARLKISHHIFKITNTKNNSIIETNDSCDENQRKRS